MYPAKDIAQYLLNQSLGTEFTIDPMKLNKLTYLAHGWFLGFFQEPLISEQVEAWKYGPVIKALYHDFKKFGASPIDRSGIGSISEAVLGNENAKAVLDGVWKEYGSQNALVLSALTHRPGSPWHTVWYSTNATDRRSVPIPNPVIERYYADKIAANQDAAAKPA